MGLNILASSNIRCTVYLQVMHTNTLKELIIVAVSKLVKLPLSEY